MRLLGWIELQTRTLALRALPSARRDPAARWLRWAREAHHGDVALACLDRAVALGDADARFEHALLEMEGLYGAAEPAISLRRAAQAGHLEAMVRLADCLRWGPGRERNPEEARAWLERAAEAGFRPAAEALARTCRDAQDEAGAAAWSARAAALPPRVLRAGLLRPLAARDPLVRAQAAVAERAASGLESLFARPGVQGLALGLLLVAVLCGAAGFLVLCVLSFGLLPAAVGAYYLLFGRRQAQARSYRRLVDAAEAGDAEAAWRLAWAYREGRAGGAADALSAAVWFRRAAEAGHRGAMGELAEALRTGHGVRRDPEEAARWSRALQA